jgi:phosphoribosylanthranilate isomerase
MARTRIKICGITRPEDAALAASLGADAVGVVLYPQARRAVSIERAQEILAALPPFVTPVALFVDQPIGEIEAAIRDLPVRHVQLHGRESPEQVARLGEAAMRRSAMRGSMVRGCAVLKAVKADRASFEAELHRWREAIARGGLTNLRGLVLETPAAAPGGTGIANDWAYIADCQQRGLFDGLPAVIAAGGLTPQTVADVVRMIRPHAVDVSSGVEAAPGQKDPHRLRDFIAAVRAAEAVEV